MSADISIVEILERVRDKGGVQVKVSSAVAATLADELSKVKNQMGESDWRLSVRRIGHVADGHVIRIERKQKVNDKLITVHEIKDLEEEL